MPFFVKMVVFEGEKISFLTKIIRVIQIIKNAAYVCEQPKVYIKILTFESGSVRVCTDFPSTMVRLRRTFV